MRDAMQAVHDSGVNYEYSWRRKHLLRMQEMVVAHRERFLTALYSDLGKSRTEAIMTELGLVESELLLVLPQLSSWMQPQHVPSPGVMAPCWTALQYRPRTGPACLILGPSNYPCTLILRPAVGALAAGNPVVIKPSELTPAIAQALQDACDEYMDPAVMRVVQGGVAETTALLQHAWGLIFFTGSGAVGKLVAAAAAQTLTPTVLELGGKCPCYVDDSIASWQIDMVANRIMWSKGINAGQTCAAVDTLFVHEAVVDLLIPALVRSIAKQFPAPIEQSEFGRIVSSRHAQRLVSLLQQVEDYIQHLPEEEPIAASAVECTKSSSSGPETRIVCGGLAACCPEERYVAPTIILHPPAHARLMQEEIFGPILPIIVVSSHAEAATRMRNLIPGATPLCLYVFTNRAQVWESMRRSCPAGSALQNDALVHLCSPTLPFGGLGTSGYGAYHGHYSFQTFSHAQPLVTRLCYPGLDLNMLRYHPFGDVPPATTTMPVTPTSISLKSRIVEQVGLRLPLTPVLCRNHNTPWILLLLLLLVIVLLLVFDVIA